MRPLKISTAPRRDSLHWETGEITWDTFLGWVDEPADRKEAGNYMFGSLSETVVAHKGDLCTGIHRRTAAVTSRSVIALDVDHPDDAFLLEFEMLYPYAAVLHSTFSHTPDEPRFRILLLTDRDMTPEEYPVLALWAMHLLGYDAFDPGSVEVARYMFKPATSDRAHYVKMILEGEPLPVDHILATFTPPPDAVPTAAKGKRDPFELAGAVGAFNRAYADFDSLFAEYDLPYEAAGPDRWRLAGSDSQAGVSLVAPGLVYSHHANDPAFNTACSAFDLVRLHRFAHLDESTPASVPVNRRPSHAAALELVARDVLVVREMVGAEFDVELDDIAADNDWRTGLTFSPRTGELRDTIANWDLICSNVEPFRRLYYNELTMSVECDGDLPWRTVDANSRTLTGTDRAALAHWLEREFKHRPVRSLLDELINTRAEQRRVNPVTDYLRALTWDGVPRLERCLPGVRDTPYTRMVARKCMVAAVARALEPGVKWDHALVIYGTEGLGKSHWIERVSRGYSASLGAVGHKDTLIAMQRSWIMVSDEGHSLRKADADAQKEFLTRTTDVFRAPYDREAQEHKRHCVIWGTTNDEVFLRRQEGNRRFLIVRAEDKVDFDALTDAYVDQLWAEAVALWTAGEALYLNAEESALAAAEREHHTEEDTLGGLITAYVEGLFPEDWDEKSLEDRQMWLLNRSSGVNPAGLHRLDEICSIQVWVEVMERRLGDHKRADLLEITAALKRLPGWAVVRGRHRVPGYGPQVVFRRQSDSE